MSGLKHHLETQHAINAKIEVTDDRQPNMASFASGSRPVSATSTGKIDGLIRNLIVENMLPISIVDSPAFVNLLLLYKSVFCTGI